MIARNSLVVERPSETSCSPPGKRRKGGGKFTGSVGIRSPNHRHKSCSFNELKKRRTRGSGPGPPPLPQT